MTRISLKNFLFFIVITALIGITYSHENDTSTEHRRQGRVNGRIVKLYSGPKPDPILCHSEGFLADAVDCSVFYRCLKASNGKYTVYRFQCGPGTVYDPDTEICNHPRSTKRSLCGGINSDRHFSSTQRYNENEIEGLQKEIEELPSPISVKPSKVNKVILNSLATSKPDKFTSAYTTNLYPWVTNSKYENNVAFTTSSWGVPASLPSVKPWDYTTSRTTTYVTPPPSRQNGVQCTSDGFMGDNEDCRKFYRCVNNQRGGYLKYEFSCSESTVWDDDTQGCNHPWAVQRRRCGKGFSENTINGIDQIKSNEVAPNHVVQQQTQISYGSKITQIQTQISKGPAIQNQTQIHFGDRINQENLNGVQHQIQTGYVETTSQSQSQVNYGNEVLQTQLQVDNSNKYSEIQTQTDTPLSSTTIPTSTLYIKHKNGDKCTRVGFIGDSNDCKKFYRCVSNEKGGFIVYEFSCSEGTLWDEDLEACNHAWAVKCGEKKSNQNKSSPAIIIENTTLNDYITTTSPHYSNEISDVGYNSQSSEPQISSTYHPPVLSTIPTFQTTTTTESPKINGGACTSNGFFGYTYDCAKFYRCVEDGSGRFKKYEYKCGDGTVWDAQIESCNHAWAVKTCNISNTNADNKESLVVSTTTGNTIISTVSLIQTTTQKNNHDYDYENGYGNVNREPPLYSTTVNDHIANHESKCKKSGFIGDNKDCKLFYRCVENDQGGFTRHNFTCGEGTVWDPDIEACNHAWAVEKCGGNAIKDNKIQEVTVSPSVPESNLEKNDSYNTNQEINKDLENIKSTTSTGNMNSATPIPNALNECQSNGFMGNDNDCKIFYRCVENGNGGFIRYEFACGEGTVWDPKLAACNHVWAVERCGGNISVDRTNYTTASTVSEITTQYSAASSGYTTLASTVSEINNQCRGNGFIGDKQDCKKFYRCVENERGSFTRYEFACGEGTVWDPEIEACNHAWAVTSCGYNISPGSEDTSKPPTTLKDEEIENNTVTQSNQEISSSTNYNSWSSSTMKSSTTGDDLTQCNTDGFMGDITDCRKFYRCVDDGKGSFIRYEFTCSDGTVWDSEITACNHINSVKTPCSSMSTETTKENEPHYTVSSHSDTNDYSTTSKGPIKTDECDQEGFYGEKTDCKKFYRCVDNGQGGFHKYEFDCGEGTIWDQEILACNHASPTSNCSSAVAEPQHENSDDHSTFSPSTSQSTEKTPISTSLQNKCTSDGFYANPNDCKKFYRCVGDGKGNYVKYDFNCGEGTVWIQEIQACDHDNDPSLCSKDKNTTITNSQQSESKPVTTSSTSTTTSTINTTTSTPNTKPTMQDETVSGSSSTTETTSSSSTSASTGNQDHCEESGYFGNSQDCRMFYRCVDNGKGGFTKYDFTCGDGTIWDQDITACNHPQDVSNPSCDNEANSSNTTMTTKATTTTTKTTEASQPPKESSSTESSTTASSSQETTTNKPSNNNYTCTQAGFYPDPNDCKKFYRCVDWGNDGKTFSIYHFDCGEGTIWDPNLQTCNHEESVYPPRDCSGKQSQNENNNGTTTTTKQDETTESSTTETTTTTSQSTTEKSTTSESTTTESSSTTDQTSTQQSSTTEQTSTATQSSTESSSTEQSTTQQPNTTQQSTTEQSTTQQSTTEQSTTPQSTTASDQTTQSSTTPESTTMEQTTTTTTEQSTTTTTEQTTTTTTEQSTTTSTEQTTTSTTDQTTTTTTEQTTTTESTTSTTDQTTTQESSTEQSSENQSSTTEQSTTQETTTGGSTTESGQETSTESSDKECPQTDNDQYIFVCPTGFRRHPKYCNLFYQCTEDDDSHEMKVAVFNCPNNTIYDESKTQCVEEGKADKKCDGEIAQRRRVKRLDANHKEPITVGRQKYSCPTLGHFPFETNEECSPVLFKCEVSKSGKMRGLLYQCPQGYVYWSISRRCEPVSIMTGCKRSLMNWSGRYEIPVERNNVARKTIK